MHLPDGRSLPLLAWRSSKSAFARGVQGTSTPSTAMLTSHFPLVVCQMPDKSGCPSGALGAGALRFGLPLGSRGMPGVGYPIHCPAAMPNAMSAISRIERGKHTAMSARKLGGMRAGNSAPREGTESAAGTGGRLPMKVDLSHRTATTLALLMLATTPLPTASAEDDGLGLAALFQQQVSRRLSVPPEERTEGSSSWEQRPSRPARLERSSISRRRSASSTTCSTIRTSARRARSTSSAFGATAQKDSASSTSAG